MSGGGVNLSGAFSELEVLAELLLTPVVTTFKGKGSFPENHSLAMGPIGMHGHAEANKIILEADCILAIELDSLIDWSEDLMNLERA